MTLFWAAFLASFLAYLSARTQEELMRALQGE